MLQVSTASFGGEWRYPAALGAVDVSVISELSIIVAHDDDPDGEFAYWRSGGRIRSDSQWMSNPWDPGDSDDHGGESRSRVGVGSQAQDQIYTQNLSLSLHSKLFSWSLTCEE